MDRPCFYPNLIHRQLFLSQTDAPSLIFVFRLMHSQVLFQHWAHREFFSLSKDALSSTFSPNFCTVSLSSKIWCTVIFEHVSLCKTPMLSYRTCHRFCRGATPTWPDFYLAPTASRSSLLLRGLLSRGRRSSLLARRHLACPSMGSLSVFGSRRAVKPERYITLYECMHARVCVFAVCVSQSVYMYVHACQV